MLPLLVRRRPDGLMQIRRLRAADVVLSSDTATILALFAGFVFFAILLFLTLVFDPPFLGVGAWAIRAHAPYDLIFANILLGPLKRIATPLRNLAAPGGRIVLSGILPSQANAVIAAYRPLMLRRRLDIDGWTTLVLARGRLDAQPL